MSSTGPVFQNALYVGMNVQDILYGVELVLYFKSMHVLLWHKGRRRKSDVFYAIFSTVMLLMITIWVSMHAVFGEKMWLEDTSFPGGPDAYWASNISVWYMDMTTTAITVLQLMTDALMIYRCRIIWDSYRVILGPVILWLATLVLGILVIWTSSSPGGNFFSGTAAELGLSYYSVSVGLTTILTWIICYRMVTHGRRVREHLGKDYANVYFAVLTLIIESALPYALSGIAFLISFGIRSSVSIAFACVYIPLMCISPQMLILRVASGRTWNEEPSKGVPSVVRFTPSDASVWTGSHHLDDGGGMHLEALSKRKETV